MSTNKVGRNELCPCGSGRKSKKCCGDTPRVTSTPTPEHGALPRLLRSYLKVQVADMGFDTFPAWFRTAWTTNKERAIDYLLASKATRLSVHRLIEDNAHHEAAHAVLGWVVSQTVPVRVSIEPVDDEKHGACWGSVLRRVGADPFDQWHMPHLKAALRAVPSELQPHVRTKAEKSAVVSLAGQAMDAARNVENRTGTVSERIARGLSLNRGDVFIAMSKLELLEDDADLRMKWFREIFEMADEAVRNDQVSTAIRRIATALLEHGELAEEALAPLLQGVPVSESPPDEGDVAERFRRYSLASLVRSERRRLPAEYILGVAALVLVAALLCAGCMALME